MAKVVMHKATDGTLFEKQKDCERHNFKLRLLPQAQAFAKSVENSEHVIAFDVNGESVPAIGMEELPQFIADHADALRSILDNASVVRRKPRKVAEPKPALTA